VAFVMGYKPNQIVSDIKSLPSVPGIAGKLLSLLNNTETTARQIEENLKYDPGLTANILKIANSSYFGFAARVGSVRQAVVLLGSRRLVQIVMASCVNAILEKPIPGYDLSPGELWRHSIAVSVASEGLMKILNIPDSGNVFTAGLLHDIGKLILGSYIHDDLDEIERIVSGGASFESAVRQIIGTDHAEIGAEILKQWSFPSDLVETTRCHHEPGSGNPANPFLDIVHVANVICMMMGIGSGREELQLEPSPIAIKRLDLKSKHIELLASQMLQWVQDLGDIFKA
jgi:putative nucleotidyltransferase with HDIG domain